VQGRTLLHVDSGNHFVLELAAPRPFGPTQRGIAVYRKGATKPYVAVTVRARSHSWSQQNFGPEYQKRFRDDFPELDQAETASLSPGTETNSITNGLEEPPKGHPRHHWQLLRAGSSKFVRSPIPEIKAMRRLASPRRCWNKQQELITSRYQQWNRRKKLRQILVSTRE
jgi:hypothetical protein